MLCFVITNINLLMFRPVDIYLHLLHPCHPQTKVNTYRVIQKNVVFFITYCLLPARCYWQLSDDQSQQPIAGQGGWGWHNNEHSQEKSRISSPTLFIQSHPHSSKHSLGQSKALWIRLAVGCSLNIVFFPKILKYSRLWPFSVFPRCQCVYTHKAGRKPALQQKWQSSEKSQHFKEKTQYLMNTRTYWFGVGRLTVY